MYPRGELNRLAARKALLQARIAVRRLECLQHAHVAAGPLQIVDRAWARWRSIAPVAKLVGVPVAMWLGGKLVRGGGLGRLAGLMKYAPLAMQAMRAFTRTRAA